MPDNVQFNVATDQNPADSAHYQKIKLVFGGNDTFTLVSSDNPLPVTGLSGGGGSGGDVTVTNFPSEYPLPDAQIITLTPPAAITNYALETGGVLSTIAGIDFATETTLSAISDLLSGTITVAGTISTGLSQPLTDTQLRAAPISVSTGLSQPLTDTQLRATAVPVSGTFYQATQPVSGTITANAGTNLNTSLLALETGGNLDILSGAITAGKYQCNITNASLAVTGTFWQATQPVSATNLDVRDLVFATDTVDVSGSVLGAGSNVIGHVICDTGSTTAITGNVSVIQGTGTNLHCVVDSGTISTITNVVHVDDNAGSLTVDGTIAATQSGVWTVQPGNTANTTAWKVDGSAVTQPVSAVSLPLPTLASTSTKQSDGSQKTQIVDGSGNVIGATSNALDINIKSGNLTTLPVTNAGTFAVQATLAAETTKVIGVIRTSDGAGNLLTSNSSTYTAKFGLDANLLGTLGTAFSTAGKVDVKGADGDLFVRQATASNLNATVVGTGTFVTQATLAAETTKIIGTVNIASSQTIACTNTGTFAVQSTPVAQADTFMLGGVNIKEINAVTPLMGNGATGTGSLRVTIANDNTDVPTKPNGNVASDAVDSGNPVKIGGLARTSLITAVGNADRVDATFDSYGRQIVTAIDPAQQIWKEVEASTAQTGTAIWTPTSGKKAVVTSIHITTGGTTAGVVTVWFGATADTTYSQGVDQVVFRGEFAPSTTSRPFAIITPPVPYFGATTDHVLRYTTSAAVTIYITVYGYEII